LIVTAHIVGNPLETCINSENPHLTEPHHMNGTESVEVPPHPAALIESLRAFGYSLPSAIADLVDNSISARASHIDIELRWDGSASWIAVMDDGAGMDEAALIQAMRLGSKSPLDSREAEDLGRFGLGMKTAAFSQARVLTVESRTPGYRDAAARWDLDHVAATGRWALLTDGSQLARELCARRAIDGHGTTVLLENLDRVTGPSDPHDTRAHEHFLDHTKRVEEHLAMTFHRFLEGGGVELTINGQPIAPWNPFLPGHPQVQRLPAETLNVSGGRILVQPYVLPHHSKLDPDAHKCAGGPRGWNPHQGFYIYRANRLLVAGGWLGLGMSAEEHFKLARISIDLDNTMDHEWHIDVKKSTAHVPRALTEDLRRIAKATRSRAAEVYRYRGKQLARSAGAGARFVWKSRVYRGQVSYQIDREHPIVVETLDASADARPQVEQLLRLVEETIPVTTIVMQSRDRPDSDRAPYEGAEADLTEMFELAITALTSKGFDRSAAISALANCEPFSDHPEALAAADYRTFE